MRIWTQKSASIQKRTNPLKFDNFAEKSEKDTVSYLSTKVEEQAREAEAREQARRDAVRRMKQIKRAVSRARNAAEQAHGASREVQKLTDAAVAQDKRSGTSLRGADWQTQVQAVELSSMRVEDLLGGIDGKPTEPCMQLLAQSLAVYVLFAYADCA